MRKETSNVKTDYSNKCASIMIHTSLKNILLEIQNIDAIESSRYRNASCAFQDDCLFHTVLKNPNILYP